jgi:hypothetical protein
MKVKTITTACNAIEFCDIFWHLLQTYAAFIAFFLFNRWFCCGNGMHTHWDQDLNTMKFGQNCPLCRAPRPSSDEEQVKQLRPWVKKKKVWALHMMGQAYRDGTGVKQSYEMARMLYELEAQQGDADAMYSLGFMYSHGQGVELSYERAKEYYEQAADLGQAEAQFNLGVMYFHGRGVERDFQRTRELWMKSAAQGIEGAIANLKILNEVEGKTSMAKTSSDPNVIVCSNCNTLQTESHKLIRCPCHSVQYCNKNCQKKHRKKHKKQCRRLMAEKNLKKTK